MLGSLKDEQRYKGKPVPGMTVQESRKVPGTVWEKVMKVPKIMNLRKNIDGTIKITQANATGLKYSRQPRQVRVSTYSVI